MYVAYAVCGHPRKSRRMEESLRMETDGNGRARRIWKRHNMASRVVTTKMRILPANFDALEENYITVTSHMVRGYKIPPDLV